MKIKVCGISNVKEVEIVTAHGADFCGFILNYPKSHRHISYEQACSLTKIKKNNTKYVGVLVNPTKNELSKFSKIDLDYFQLYGDYKNEEILEIKEKYKKKIIMTIQVEKESDVLKYKDIERYSDIILWDSSGLEKSISWNFDWINLVPKNITKMLAGNINLNNLEKLSKIADIVDVSGALETNKVKDIIKIKNFTAEVKKINHAN